MKRGENEEEEADEPIQVEIKLQRNLQKKKKKSLLEKERKGWKLLSMSRVATLL